MLKPTTLPADAARMHSGPIKLALAVFVVAALAATGVIYVLQRDGGSGSSSGSGGDAIWSTGDAWVVQVRQSGTSVSPGADPDATTKLAYRFRVVQAPEAGDRLWRVDVRQDGASGPFADGWHLFYREAKDGSMRLAEVAQGSGKPAAAEVATIVLGMTFPYELKYTAPPKDRTVDEADLMKRSATPPSLGDRRGASVTTVTGGTGGAAPPKDAPVVPAGEAPPGAPQG